MDADERRRTDLEWSQRYEDGNRENLAKRLAMLRAAGVRKYEDGALKIEFDDSAFRPVVTAAPVERKPDPYFPSIDAEEDEP